MELLKTLTDFLDEIGIHYKTQNNVISYNFMIDASFKEGSQLIIVNDDSYIVETSLAIRFKPASYALLLEFIARANVNMEIGYFVLDEESGILTHILKTDCADSKPSREVIHESVMLAIRMLGVYGYANAIYYLCAGLLPPAQAIDFIRRPDND